MIYYKKFFDENEARIYIFPKVKDLRGFWMVRDLFDGLFGES